MNINITIYSGGNIELKKRFSRVIGEVLRWIQIKNPSLRNVKRGCTQSRIIVEPLYRGFEENSLFKRYLDYCRTA